MLLSLHNLEPGIALIKRFEGLHLKTVIQARPMIAPYLCPAGVPTIGYGHVCSRDQQPITEAQADSWLDEDADKAENAILRMVKTPITDGQLNALLSFVFNVGSGNFRASTLLYKINHDDILGAAAEFPKWRFGGGRVLPGLVARRLAEKELFLN